MNRLIILILLIFIKFSFSATAQNSYWSTTIPGFQYNNYRMKTDIEGGLHIALNSGDTVKSNLFISYDKYGKILYRELTKEFALFNFRDSNLVQYLISFDKQILRVRRISPTGILLSNTLVVMPSSINQFPSPIEIQEFFSSLDICISTNNKFWLAGEFYYDPIFGQVTESFNLIGFDFSSTPVYNVYNWPAGNYNFYKLKIQEDSLGNINIFRYFPNFSEVAYQKVSPTGTILMSGSIGDMFVGNFPIVAFKLASNFIYLGTDEFQQGFRVLKLNKNTFDTVFFTPVINPQFEESTDFFDADDSSFFRTSSTNNPNHFEKFDENGLSTCSSTTPLNAGILFFNDGKNNHAVRMYFNDVTDTCGVLQKGKFIDINTQLLLHGGPISPTSHPEDFLYKDDTYYIACRDVNFDFSIVAFSDSSFLNFGGKLYFDQNNNCLLDNGEVGFPNKLISLNPGGPYVFTNQLGNFNNHLDTGNYLVEAVAFNSTSTFCPSSIPLNVIDTTLLYDSNFIGVQDQPNNLHDISVSLFQTSTVPGQLNHSFITINNIEPLPAFCSLKLMMEPGLYTFQSSSVTPDSIVGNSVYWHIDSLKFLNPRKITVIFQTSNMATIGTPFINSIEAINLFPEANTSNNFSLSDGVVLSSFDPNDKQVVPRGLGSNGEINLNDSVLNYKIRFQNEGTFKAFDVKIIDTLDINLDLSTFRLETYSHPVQITMIAPRVIEFYFENIMLPPASINYLLSQGFLQYSIETNPNLPLNTQIQNAASIYFDFNPVIQTNIAINTITTVGLTEEESKAEFILSPNPTTNILVVSNLRSSLGGEIQLLDMQGRILMIKKYYRGQETIELQVNQLSRGHYLIKNIDEHGASTKALIKL